MARAQVDKATTTPANSYDFSTFGLLNAALFRVDGQGAILQSPSGYFLLNPSTFEETKSANWVQNAVPGQSDPILQWISSGPRMVTFDALVTMDTSAFIKQRQVVANKSSANFIATIASKFFNTATPAPRTDMTNTPSVELLDISSYLNYYRSLLYPLYDNSTTPNKLTSSPPILTLWTGSSFTKNPYGQTIRASDDLWVLTNLTIRVTKQLTNLAPQEAMVTFQLLQYTVAPFAANRFTDEAPNKP